MTDYVKKDNSASLCGFSLKRFTLILSNTLASFRSKRVDILYIHSIFNTSKCVIKMKQHVKEWKECQRQKSKERMMERMIESKTEGEIERDWERGKRSMVVWEKMGYISPLFDSLFSVATPRKESRQLAPYNLNHTTQQHNNSTFWLQKLSHLCLSTSSLAFL